MKQGRRKQGKSIAKTLPHLVNAKSGEEEEHEDYGG